MPGNSPCYSSRPVNDANISSIEKTPFPTLSQSDHWPEAAALDLIDRELLAPVDTAILENGSFAIDDKDGDDG